jgi:hypothetical protein
MPSTAGKPSSWSILAAITAWAIAALCLALCSIAFWLWQTDLTIRRSIFEMGYNEILELREDAWLQFRAPLAWTSAIMSLFAAATGCIPAVLVRQPLTCLPVAIAAVVSLGTLGYLLATR